MKIYNYQVIVFFFLACFLTEKISAQTFDNGLFRYTILSGTDVSIGSTTCPTGNLDIPSTIVHNDITYDVTKITDDGFKSCSNLTTINIPNSIISIGNNAFSYSGLTEVNIPNSVTNIDQAFLHCKSLTNVYIGNSVNSMDFAFFGCDNLRNVNIPSSITKMTRTFYACKSLSSIVIPNSVTELRETFRGCVGLTSVEIGNSVSQMLGAFSGCSNLTNVDLPNSLINMNNAFTTCTSLYSIDIPNSVSSMDGSFSGCSELAFVNLGNSVTILNRTFSNCISLASIVIPNTVVEMNNAFSNCTELSSIIIPNSVKDLDGAFGGCTGLQSVHIGSSVNTMSSTFNGCTELKSVTIPNSVKNLTSTFANCTGLISVNLGSTITRLYSTFEGCTGLKSIKLPSSIKNMNFTFRNCTSLRSIVNLSSVPQIIDNYTFDGLDLSQLSLLVPYGSQDGYNNSSIWEDFGDINSINKVSSGPFNLCYYGISRKIEGNNNSSDIYFHDETGELICMLNANGNNLGNVNVSVYNSSTDRDINGTPYMNRNVTITPDEQPTSPVTVRIYYTADEFNALQAEDPSITLGNLQFVKTGGSCSGSYDGTQPVELAQDLAGYIFTTEHFVEAQVSNFSTFFATKTSALPVKFTFFEAHQVNTGIQLDWTTASELNNEGFDIQHSTDGGNWTLIGHKAGAGNSTETLSYRFLHAAPTPGVNYYRLKQVDYDGNYTYSPVKQVQIDQELNTIYPNPANDRLYLAQPMPYEVYNHMGRLIQKGRGGQVNLTDFSRGLYYIKIEGETHRFSKL